MRVVLLARSLGVGGAERQITELAPRLATAGHDVHVVLFYEEAVGFSMAASPVQVHRVGKTGRWDVIGFGVRLVRLLRRLRPDVIYAFLVVPNIISVAVKPFVRGAAVVWGVRASRMELSHYGRFARLSFSLSRLLARRADLIVANSESGLRDHTAAGYPASRLMVVPNGIDTDKFVMDRAAGSALRAEWLGGHGRLVGVVARIDPKKGHEDLLRAISHLGPEHDAAGFVFVGPAGAADSEALERLAVELGVADRVVWAGSRSDMLAVYNALDVLCLPSRFGEGFPNVVGEAMACGIPAAVTDVGDAAFVIGPEGAVAPPGDPRALAGAIGRTLDMVGRDRGLALRCRARIVENFGTEQLVDNTIAALRRATTGPEERPLP